MKLNKKDNIRLMCECCIVREIEYTQHGKEEQAQEFKLLRKTIENSKNLSFEDLKEAYSNSSFSIKSFINQMESYKKSTLNRSYYRKARKEAEKYYSSFENSEKEEFNAKLSDQFFNKNRISNLKTRANRQRAKFIGGTTIAALLAAGAIAISNGKDESINPNHDEKTFTFWQDSTPIPTQEQTISDIDIHDTDFENKFINDFEQLYADEYNVSHNSNLSTDDFTFAPSNQDYIYQIKVGNEYRYVSHGDYPDNINAYLEKNNIKFKSLSDVQASFIYSINADGEIKHEHDEFNNSTPTQLDAEALVKNPDTGELEHVKLYDGNNPTLSGLLDLNSTNNSVLAKMGNIVHVFSFGTNSEQDRIAFKEKYLSEVNQYQENSMQLNNCAIEEKIDHQLSKEEMER